MTAATETPFAPDTSFPVRWFIAELRRSWIKHEPLASRNCGGRAALPGRPAAVREGRDA